MSGVLSQNLATAQGLGLIPPHLKDSSPASRGGRLPTVCGKRGPQEHQECLRGCCPDSDLSPLLSSGDNRLSDPGGMAVGLCHGDLWGSFTNQDWLSHPGTYGASSTHSMLQRPRNDGGRSSTKELTCWFRRAQRQADRSNLRASSGRPSRGAHSLTRGDRMGQPGRATSTQDLAAL